MSSKRKDADLYGRPRPKKLKAAETSNSQSFSSQLASLISSSTTRTEKAPTFEARQRPKKDDIFTVHNKNAKKRAQKDVEDVNFKQKHSTTNEALDHDIWRQSQRKMQDKARLYAAIKRGDVEDVDDKYAVDFDRKWAEEQERAESEVSSDNDGDSEEEQIEYEDEFGRTRTGTRAQVARAQANRNRAAAAADALPDDRFTARPNMPSNIIYGNNIQTAAFNPDAETAAQQAELAAKRDKSLTPPPDEHFDGRKEFRTKGVSFFQFSADKEERERQMDELEKQRGETERARQERQEKEEDITRKQHNRRQEIEERRRMLAERRTKAKADKFLDAFANELSGNATPRRNADGKNG